MEIRIASASNGWIVEITKENNPVPNSIDQTHVFTNSHEMIDFTSTFYPNHTIHFVGEETYLQDAKVITTKTRQTSDEGATSATR